MVIFHSRVKLPEGTYIDYYIVMGIVITVTTSIIITQAVMMRSAEVLGWLVVGLAALLALPAMYYLNKRSAAWWRRNWMDAGKVTLKQ